MSFDPRRQSYPPCALVFEVNGKPEMPPEFSKRVKKEYGGEEGLAEFKRLRQVRYEELKGEGVKDAYWTAHNQIAQDYPPTGAATVVSGGDNGKEPLSDLLDDLDSMLSDDVPDGDDERSLSSRLSGYGVWLDRNLGRKKLNPKDPPPSAMCGFIWTASRNPANFPKILDFIAKHLPPPKFIEEKLRMEDDGSNTIDLINRVEEAIS